MARVIEICVDNLQSLKNALAGGANRIELGSALSEGGLTPSVGFLKLAKSITKVPIFCMLRCRAGFDFNYTREELEIMLEDAKILKQTGADGFVFGALDQNLGIDLKKCFEIVKTVWPLPVTFHRAFDVCNNPLVALEAIADAGFKRVLTSGQKKTAIEGKENIKKFVESGKIIIIAGCGIDENNLGELLDFVDVREIHGSASRVMVKDGEEMEIIEKLDSTRLKITDEDIVKKMVGILNCNHEINK